MFWRIEGYIKYRSGFVNINMDLIDKKEKLAHILGDFDSLLIAFSGGVDSTFLLAKAHELIGDRLLAVTAYSAVHPLSEKEAARDLAKVIGVEHMFVASQEMEDTEFILNKPDRCYRCKARLFRQLWEIASHEGIQHVAHGANADDAKDYRPGQKAADEMQIKAPLLDAGLTKSDIRTLSREIGLPTWHKPSMACLATRIPYGDRLTVEKLARVEQAEKVLHTFGFTSCRVRHHDRIARIEVPPEAFDALVRSDVRVEIVRRIRKIGYAYVALDLEGYSPGSMNRSLELV
jgi:uncharacterized protein